LIDRTHDLGLLVEGFELSLHATNKSAKLVETYMDSCRQFVAFLRERGVPTALLHIRGEHAEA
jgi:hypothetical protein